MVAPSHAATIFYDGFLSNPDGVFHGSPISGTIDLELNSTIANTPNFGPVEVDGNIFASVFNNALGISIAGLGSDTFLGDQNNGSISLVTGDRGNATITARNPIFLEGNADVRSIQTTLRFFTVNEDVFNSGNIGNLSAFKEALESEQIRFTEGSFEIVSTNIRGNPNPVSETYTFNDAFIQVSGIPEPSTSAALALALIGGLARRSRDKKGGHHHE